MKKSNITQDQIDRVKCLFDQGFGERRIAQQLNITRGLVHGAYKILGIYGAGHRSKNEVKSRIPTEIAGRCLIYAH
jgi:hypothetical protein